MRHIGLGLVAVSLVLIACTATPVPSTPRPTVSGPAPTPQPSPSAAAAAYDLAPPRQIQDWLRSNVGLTFRPLTASELAGVRLSLADAERLALDEPGPGYGPDDSHITWTGVGCVYLGYYIGPMEPRLGYVPPEFVAYLVQRLGPPASGFPGLNVGIVPVNAVTGEKGTRFGFGDGPILGTTCGASP